jgi:hypothetical protein
MEIDESDEQSQKASCLIADTVAPISKVTVERFRQPQKHSTEIISTEAGIQIDERDEHHLNPHAPSRDMVEPGAKVTTHRAL